MLNRNSDKLSPEIALTKNEIRILGKMILKKNRRRSLHLSDYLLQLAKMGGYLARSGDPPPGILVLCRGLSVRSNLNYYRLIVRRSTD